MNKDLIVVLFLVIVIVFIPIISISQNSTVMAKEEPQNTSISDSTKIPVINNINSSSDEISSVNQNSLINSSTSTISEESSSTILPQKDKLVDQVEQTDKQENTIKKNIYTFDRDYFNLYDKSSGKIIKVNVSDYVVGAIAAEMPSTFHTEALTAQGIAALSYAIYNVQKQQQNPNPNLKGADFSVDVENRQGYATFDKIKEFYGDNWNYNWEKIKDAAQVAEKYILTYNNEPIAAAYHAISSGNTEKSENVWGEPLPYLTAVSSSADILAKDYKTTVVISPEDIKEKLAVADAKFLQDINTWFEVISRSDSGYVTEIRVGNKTISGLDFRNLLGLRSSCFSIERQGNNFMIIVCGYGHGVGLSQNGADYMARQGSSFEEILNHYYPNTTLMNFNTV